MIGGMLLITTLAVEEEEDDGLDLEFIAQVQKERTSLRALEQAQSQAEVPAS